MSRYEHYITGYEDGIDKMECRYKINEVCCNADCDSWVADYPPVDYCRKGTSICEYFVEEE